MSCFSSDPLNYQQIGLGNFTFPGLIIVSNKFGHSQLTQVGGKYLVRHVGGNLTIVKISYRDIVLSHPSQVVILDRDSDQDWNTDYHRVYNVVHVADKLRHVEISGDT